MDRKKKRMKQIIMNHAAWCIKNAIKVDFPKISRFNRDQRLLLKQAVFLPTKEKKTGWIFPLRRDNTQDVAQKYDGGSYRYESGVW